MSSMNRVWLENDQAYGDIVDANRSLTLEEYRLDTLVGCADCLMATAESLEHAEGSTSMEGYRFVTQEILGEDSVSLEGIKETLAKAWDALKRSLRELLDKLATYFQKIFRGTKALRNTVDELEEKLLELDRASATMKTQTFKFAKMEVFAPDNNPNARMLLSGVSDANRNINDARQAYLDSALEVFEALNSYSGRMTASIKSDSNEKAFAAVTALDDQINKAFTQPFERLRGAQRVKLPGGKRIEVREKPFTGTTVLEIRVADSDFEYRGDRSVQTPSLNELKSFVKEIRQGIRQLENVRPDSDKLLARYKDAMSNHDRFVNSVPDEELGELGKKAVNAWTRLVYWLLRSGTIGNINRLTFYQYRVIRTALAFVKESLDKYE